MAKAERAARTIQYCLAVVRQVFNYALNNNLFVGKNPAGANGGVKRPKVDNGRTRFLSRQKAADLLEEISKGTPDIHGNEWIFNTFASCLAMDGIIPFTLKNCWVILT